MDKLAVKGNELERIDKRIEEEGFIFFDMLINTLKIKKEKLSVSEAIQYVLDEEKKGRWVIENTHLIVQSIFIGEGDETKKKLYKIRSPKGLKEKILMNRGTYSTQFTGFEV